MAMDSPIRRTHAGTPTSATPPPRSLASRTRRLRIPDSPTFALAPTLSPTAAVAAAVLTPRQAYVVAESSPATAVDPAAEEPHLMLTSPLPGGSPRTPQQPFNPPPAVPPSPAPHSPFPDGSPRTRPRQLFNPPAVPPSPAPQASAVTVRHTAHLRLPPSETNAADTPITAPTPAPSNTNDDRHTADAALLLNVPAEQPDP